MKWSALLAAARCEPGRATLALTEDWMQGRSAFGGLQSALALRAMRTLVAAELPLRTLQTTFVAPAPAGETVATARMLRSGKSAHQVEATIARDGDVLALVVGVFGSARASRVSHVPAMPRLSHPVDRPLPHLPEVLPRFLQHFDARWVEGDLPFSGSSATRSTVELGLRDEGPADESHVVALADFIPPVALSWMPGPTPGSSVTWMLELLLDRFDHLPLQGWRVDAELVAARDGYTSQSTTIWTPHGQAAALSHQSMVVFG